MAGYSSLGGYIGRGEVGQGLAVGLKICYNILVPDIKSGAKNNTKDGAFY